MYGAKYNYQHFVLIFSQSNYKEMEIFSQDSQIKKQSKSCADCS